MSQAIAPALLPTRSCELALQRQSSSAKRTRLVFTRSPTMTRRFWLRCFAWILGSLAAFQFARRATADQQQATLNELLRSMLKCRRPQEFTYIDLVTQKVDA